MGQDVYIERIIRKKPDARSYINKGAIVVGGAALSFIALLLSVNEFLGFIFPLVFASSCVGGYYLFRRQNIEFEYSVTNGELDVDRIIARSSRRHVLTVDCRSFDMLAPMTEEHVEKAKNATIGLTVDASSGPSSGDRWFCLFNGADGMRTLLIFEPDERMLNAFRVFIPGRFREIGR